MSHLTLAVSNQVEKVVPSNTFLAFDPLLIQGMKLCEDLRSTGAEYKGILKALYDYVRLQIGINNIIIVNVNDDKASALVHVFDVEAKEGIFYKSKFDDSGIPYIELIKGAS
ncbi:hypothetical protein JR311_20370 (plasmid) [Bacillus velezensis]|uniref:hypothetical protein n=1 Tax=Bacillus velezensis TaxID=492670 RepID=UPI00195DDA4D|nr:hypothetical protein [Bacillus velezensis]QRV11379.1 hypothetical protein JR311_20370 [Bacillus velezensis]